MTDILTNKEDGLQHLVDLKIEKRKRRKICDLIVGRKSFSVAIPQGSKLEFERELERIMEEDLPKTAKQFGRPVQEIRILDHKAPGFNDRLAELRENKDGFRESFASDYQDQLPEINVWFNPDGLALNADQQSVFLHALQYGQNIFVFDHEYIFSRLDDGLKGALGRDCSFFNLCQY